MKFKHIVGLLSAAAMSVALAAPGVTFAARSRSASTVSVDGQAIVGGVVSTTWMVEVHELVLPAPSVAT